MSLIKIIRNKPLGGFTIVETMIFLIISSAVFVSVAMLIGGQLDRYQSRDAIDNLESIVRGALNDVANGYYPMIASKFNCSVDASGMPIVSSVPAGAGGYDRGENKACVIVGKGLVFETKQLTIQTYVAGSDITTINLGKITTIKGLEEVKEYKWGVELPTKVEYYILNTNFENVAKGEIDSTSTLVSGAQAVKLYDGGLNLVTDDTKRICFDNGRYKSSLEFSTKGALVVTANYQDEGCEDG